MTNATLTSIVNHVVNNQPSLDSTFAALADPTRRGILEQLSKGRTRVTDLAEPFQMSLPAVSKHLKVLERAGLIQRRRQGREHHIQVDPKPIRQARRWIALYARYWEDQFDALDDFLADAQSQGPSPAKRRKNRKES